MGLFHGKQQPKKDSDTDEVAEAVETLFDDHFREELRNYGRRHFKKIIDDNSRLFKHDLDTAISHVSVDLKDYMIKQLDTTVAHLNEEMAKQLDKRLKESDRLTSDAQDLAVQSLNRNAQALHDKYQQLGQTLEQTITSQEAMMITVFEENKTQIATAQDAQDSALHSLNDSAEASKKQSEQLSEALQKVATDQEVAMGKVFEENMARLTATKDAQDEALRSLNESVKSLHDQSEQLSATLEQSINSQKEVMTNAFQENMARVIEHYVLGALGDQYDMKAQLPSIIKQMETNKQAIVDDMKL